MKRVCVLTGSRDDLSQAEDLEAQVLSIQSSPYLCVSEGART